MKAVANGLTLIELLCVIACLSLLFMLALPLGLTFRAELKLTAAVDQLRHVFAVAQGEALSRGQSVLVCGSQDAKACNGHWEQGQLILVAEGAPWRSFKGFDAITLSYHGNFGRNQAIRFLANGMTYGQDGRFDVCMRSSWVKPRCHSVILHFSGQTVG